MKELKEKIKTFVKRHKTKLIVGATLIATGVVLKISNDRSFEKGATRGLVVGFHATIDWFDEEFSELHLRELYNDWTKDHQDEMMYIES